MKHRETPEFFARIFGIAVCLLMVCSCKSSKPFHLNVNAEEPIKVDLTMDVHVYNHAGDDPKKTETKLKSTRARDDAAAKYTQVLEQRRNRMAEVQEMKNGRYVGENRLGLLELRSLPQKGSAQDWVKKTLYSENEDRKFLMDHEAETKSKSLKTVQSEQRQHILRKSHVGEWVEIDDLEIPGSYKWIQKVSPKKDATSAELPDVAPVEEISN